MNCLLKLYSSASLFNLCDIEIISPAPYSEPPSITESMHIMDEILSDTKMDRFDKIEKLEAVLNSVIPDNQEQLSSVCGCSCHCRQNGTANHVQTLNAECQTLSTGDIAITNIFYEQNKNQINRTITVSDRRK